ncbi:MAG: carbohydrate binding domain-containing protein [Phycisphaerales bacterium]|nr:MAG: carbohydrate binding domain-containing protein [Phycisphaerales bacterium]
MNTCRKTILLYAVLSLYCCREGASANLVASGGFEETKQGRASGWMELWTRKPGCGEVTLDKEVFHSGSYAARIEHRGAEDWSFGSEKRLDVKPGDVFTLQAWVKIKGTGNTTIGVITYDDKGKALEWAFGGRTTAGPRDWHLLRSRFVIPRKVVTIHPRLIGYRPATVWLDDFSLVKEGNVMETRPKDMAERFSISNATISLTLHTADATLSVTDMRTGQSLRQWSLDEGGILRSAEVGDNIEMTLLHAPSGMDVRTILQLEPDCPEFTVTLSAEGDLEQPLRFPHPFVTEPGTYLVVPMNEGISYPVEDKTINTARLIAYGGHGICMAFWGATDGERGYMAIIETPDDALVRIERCDGRLCLAPMWESQKGQFGYARKLRYVFFDKGGHVAICKRYRSYANKAGLLKTLAQKRREDPNVDLLVGAVNVWCWDRDALQIVRDLKSVGIDRVLWSNRKPPRDIKAMNEMGGILTSRYDIYQDLMDPKVVKEQLRGLHPDWTQDAWPKDIMLDQEGEWRKGWRVRGKDGQMYPCAVLCDRQALAHARNRVPDELKTHPYRCRFIDTTTASPWRECYHPDHPMTRSDSRHWKMELLRYMSEEMGLVTGSETGHEAAVPYVHYFEGMLSLGPYRVPDAGRNMIKVWDEVPERVAKFQVGHKYRLPLWELVYHDCVVAQWYWGDYNNKLPSIWDKRDLFNILYGTPPMFMFNRQIWQKNKARFAQSYKDVCSVARAVGYAEMIDHRLLTPDRDVQQTSFANGVTVTVNFGERPFRLPDGKEIEPMSHHVSGTN